MKITKYEKDVLRSAQDNHIWINAMTLINPSEKTLQHIGQSIVDMLNQDENLILSDFDGGHFESLKLKELIVRINKS